MADDRDAREHDRLAHGPWTPGELRVLALVARGEHLHRGERVDGEEFVRRFAHLILEQARAIDGEDLEVVE